MRRFLTSVACCGLAAFAVRAAVPVFAGFEDARYQIHDVEIQRAVDDFNNNTSTWIGGTEEQAQAVAPLSAALVKSHMLQESGGGDMKSRAAWRRDPLQINVPGDWNEYKRYLGLKKPRRTNDGSARGNLRAGIMFLSRKGFGVSGQPAENRPSATFDGWKVALQRYNGRTDRTRTGRPYYEAYAERILARAKNPNIYFSIPIK